ncbi:MAG: non-homologous end-joining DNA ligase, partial [Alphaproteobacteria bacterium]|nr:non-homologous end-joining DNA ligase [Alphaproteobacteria bacterium]
MSALDDYNARRNFMRTPEPFGAIGPTDPDALRFVVQRHEAKRLHFDLRLEWGGLLRSWAVPEGPSLDPADKRLAIATEDHPLDYLGFEGVIPQDEYGAGVLRLWDAGEWVPLDADAGAALEAGEIKFRLAGVRLTGGFMLKKLPKGKREWLLIKERDTGVVKGYEPEVPKPRRFARSKPPGEPAKLPKKVSPMLPSPVDSPPEFDGWLHEIKFDGYRTLIRKEGDEVRFFTRQGLDWTERYQALVPHIAELDCEAAIIDGEVAVQDARGATSLEQLQQALSEGRDHDLVFYAFDLVHLNDRDLSALPLIERKNWLRRLVPADPMRRIQFSDHVEGDGRKLFAQACRLGLEGVVSKRKASKYRQERSKQWLKAKRFDVATFTVIGYTTNSSSRHVASIILAEDTGELTYVGRAGTGLSLDETRALYEELSALEIGRAPIDVPKTPNAHFIAPGQYEADISYRGRTTKNIIRQAAILEVRAIGQQPKKKRQARLITDRDLAQIRLTNPDRSYDGETTKLDVALWYAKAGEWMLPHLMNRPVTLIR